MEERCTTSRRSGGTRNISGKSHYHIELEAELADLHGKEVRAALHFGLYLERGDAFHARQAASGLHHLLRLAEPRLDDRRIRNSGAKAGLPPQRPGTPRGVARRSPADAPQADRLRSVYSMTATSPRSPKLRPGRQYNALTYLDEVHAVGMSARAAAAFRSVRASPTGSRSSKARSASVRSEGLLHFGRSRIIDVVRSYAPGFIFTTSLSPVLVAGALASVRHLKASTAEREAQQLRAAQLRRSSPSAPAGDAVDDPYRAAAVGDPVTAKRISASCCRIRQSTSADKLPDRAARHRAAPLHPRPRP